MSLVGSMVLACSDKPAGPDASVLGTDIGSIEDAGWAHDLGGDAGFDSGRYAPSDCGPPEVGERADSGEDFGTPDAGFSSDADIGLGDSGLFDLGWPDLGPPDLGTSQIGDPCISAASCTSPQICVDIKEGAALVCTQDSVHAGGGPCPTGSAIGYYGLYCLPQCNSRADCWRLTGFECGPGGVCEPPAVCFMKTCPPIPGYPMVCDDAANRCVHSP